MVSDRYSWCRQILMVSTDTYGVRQILMVSDRYLWCRQIFMVSDRYSWCRQIFMVPADTYGAALLEGTDMRVGCTCPAGVPIHIHKHLIFYKVRSSMLHRTGYRPLRSISIIFDVFYKYLQIKEPYPTSVDSQQWHAWTRRRYERLCRSLGKVHAYL